MVSERLFFEFLTKTSMASVFHLPFYLKSNMIWVHLVVRNVRTVCAVNSWKIVRKVTWICFFFFFFLSVKNWIALIPFNNMEKSVSKRWKDFYFWVNYSFNTFPHSFSFSCFLLCSLSNTFSDKPWKSPEIMRHFFLIHTQLPPSPFTK